MRTPLLVTMLFIEGLVDVVLGVFFFLWFALNRHQKTFLGEAGDIWAFRNGDSLGLKLNELRV